MKKWMMAAMFAGAVVLVSGLNVSAQHEPSAQAETLEPSYPHPTLPDGGIAWPSMVLAFIAVMFISAASIGWFIRLERPDELPPPAHSHDEPPGASGHHGPGGTIQPAPEHDDSGHGGSHH